MAGLPFVVIDTGGFDDRGAVALEIQNQVEQAIQHADVILFMLDAKEGVNLLDEHFGNWLRKKLGEIKKKRLQASDKLANDSKALEFNSNLDSPKKHTPTSCELIVLANKTEGSFLSYRVLDTIAEAF